MKKVTKDIFKGSDLEREKFNKTERQVREKIGDGTYSHSTLTRKERKKRTARRKAAKRNNMKMRRK